MADSKGQAGKILNYTNNSTPSIARGVEIFANGKRNITLDFHGYNDGTIKFSDNYLTRIHIGTQTNSGRVTFQYNTNASGGVTIEKGGLIITAGGLTVTAGGLTISADGISITGNASINGHTYIQGAHHIYFNSGHSHGIIWRENDTTYAGEALYIGGYFSGADDSNYLHIQGSATGGTSTSWHDIMTLTAKSGNLSTSGSIFAGTLSTAREIDVGARANAGSIYFYSASTTNGSRGIWAKNHNGTGHYFLYCTQDNLIHSNAYSTAVSGICVRDIQVQDSASNSVSTKYIIMKRG